MRGKWYKELCKRNHYSREEKEEHRHRWALPESVRGRLVYKTVRKLWKMFSKASWYDGDGCVFWYDQNDGLGYRECCGLLGGRCDDRNCPYSILEQMCEGMGIDKGR